MTDIDRDRRDFMKNAGTAALGAALAGGVQRFAVAQPASGDFDINASFAEFMRGIGGTPSDAGGKVTFTGRDPIVRSHFRIASSMAIPAMGAGVSAAAIWRERTGQPQDLKVDLRESMYNVNPADHPHHGTAPRDGADPGGRSGGSQLLLLSHRQRPLVPGAAGRG